MNCQQKKSVCEIQLANFFSEKYANDVAVNTISLTYDKNAVVYFFDYRSIIETVATNVEWCELCDSFALGFT